jgi:protein-S-isoprenylcysteine O-methyltransferase Ste14
MYLAVLAVILGWTLVLGSGALAAYLCVVAVGFHLRVTLSEEPWLRRQFGSDSERYLATVPRWIPRIRTK